MTIDKRTSFLTRDRLLKLLSDDEIAKVSAAESGAKLAEGEEYVDLGQLTKGVQRSHGAVVSMGTVLPRSAVHEQTWSKIVTQLQGPSATARS